MTLPFDFRLVSLNTPLISLASVLLLMMSLPFNITCVNIHLRMEIGNVSKRQQLDRKADNSRRHIPEKKIWRSTYVEIGNYDYLHNSAQL